MVDLILAEFVPATDSSPTNVCVRAISRALWPFLQNRTWTFFYNPRWGLNLDGFDVRVELDDPHYEGMSFGKSYKYSDMRVNETDWVAYDFADCAFDYFRHFRIEPEDNIYLGEN